METDTVKLTTPPPPQANPAGSASPERGRAEQASASVAPSTAQPVADTVTLSRQSFQALEKANSSRPANPEPRTEGAPRAEQPAIDPAASSRRQFDLTANNQVILKVVDQNSGKVEKQVPPEAQVRLNEAISKTVDELTQDNSGNE